MSLRRAYAPLRPEFDDFLFAAVGNEINGVPLSVISMLTQLGFDPWQEGTHLTSLARREATERLTQIIARLPQMPWPEGERAEIADNLIKLLPRRAEKAAPAHRQSGRSKLGGWTIVTRTPKLWLIAMILGAAIVVTIAAQGTWPFGGHLRSEFGSSTEAPLR